MCRSGNVIYLGDCNNDVEQEENESESQGTQLNPVAFAELTSKNGLEEYNVDKFSVMAISEAFEIKHATNLPEDNINGHIIKLKTKTADFFQSLTPGVQCGSLLKKPPGGYK